MSNILEFSVGMLAQVFFGARVLVQWVLSEKARKVLSPSIYWILSIAGSILFFIYGWLRNDFAILFGQFFSYYIYLWNLKQKGIWEQVHPSFRALFFLIPLVAIGLSIKNWGTFVSDFLNNSAIPTWLILFGCLGQLLFSFRFIYQWLYSVKRKESVLPGGFWIISIVGSSTIIAYGVLRRDPVLILGQSFGFVAYYRNLILSLKTRNGNA